MQVFATATYKYNCQGNIARVAFPEGSEKAILDYSGELHLLRSVIQGSGSRYLGDGWELLLHHDQLYLTKVTQQQSKDDRGPFGEAISCLDKN
jgi:hypothetical protein